NTARNFLPLSPGVGMKVNVGDVAAPMSVNVAPPSELLCHWTVGSGMPVAAATNVAGWPAATVKSIGCNVIDGSTDATDDAVTTLKSAEEAPKLSVTVS